MQITNKEYEVLKDAKGIVSTLRDNLTSDYLQYLKETSTVDAVFEAKLGKLIDLEFELIELLKTIDVVG